MLLQPVFMLMWTRVRTRHERDAKTCCDPGRRRGRLQPARRRGRGPHARPADAVRCAIEVQNGMAERNAGLPPERRIEFRVGIHLGDVGDILYAAWGARRELQSGRKPIMNAIEEMIRERAYELWDHAGRPSGGSDEFWFAARAEFERKKGTAEGQRGAPVRPAKEPISLNSNSSRTKPTPTRSKDAKASPVSSGARPQPTNANANRAEARIARGKTKSATPPIRSPGKAPKQDVGASEPVAPPLEPKSRHGAQTIAAKWTKWKKQKARHS